MHNIINKLNSVTLILTRQEEHLNFIYYFWKTVLRRLATFADAILKGTLNKVIGLQLLFIRLTLFPSFWSTCYDSLFKSVCQKADLHPSKTI